MTPGSNPMATSRCSMTTPGCPVQLGELSMRSISDRRTGPPWTGCTQFPPVAPFNSMGSTRRYDVNTMPGTTKMARVYEGPDETHGQFGQGGPGPRVRRVELFQ